MQLISFSLLFVFGAAYGLHRIGQRSSSVPFFAARVSTLMALLLTWFWQGPTLALQTSSMTSALLVFVPAAAGLAGLVGIEILRFQPAPASAIAATARAQAE